MDFLEEVGEARKRARVALADGRPLARHGNLILPQKAEKRASLSLGIQQDDTEIEI